MVKRGTRRRTAQLGAIGLLILLGLMPAARALDPHRSLNHYGHQVWRTDSGLPQNTVHAVLQTRDGYMWLGTDGGLVRFDGVDWVTFDAENTPQFKSDTVNDLLEDPSAGLWISTAAGLLTYRDGTFAAFTTAQGLPSDIVWFTHQDHGGRIWAITSAGPAWWNGKAFSAVAGTQAAAPTNRQAMAEDLEGRLWLGSSSGVFAVETSGTPRLALHQRSGVETEAVELDRQGNVWIGTNQGLERYPRGALTPTRLSSSSAEKTEVSALHHDASGGMWVGTTTGLLHLAGDGALLPGPEAAGQPTEESKRVDSLFEDREGALWIAREHGVLRLQGDQLQSFAAGSDLAINRVLATYEDREGNLWLGTDSGGLNLLRDQKFLTYTTADGLSGNFVRCVFQNSDGALWIGTDGNGLNRRTRSGFLQFTTADGLSSNVILSLAAGPNGAVWVGTPDGLNLLHFANETKEGETGESQARQGEKGRPRVRVERFTLTDGLPDDFIRSLFSDRDGSLWIGTRHGLSHLSQGKFTSYSSLDGLGSDFIGVIFRAHSPPSSVPHVSPAWNTTQNQVEAQGDFQGDLWIGTSGGLTRLHEGVFTNFTLPPTSEPRLATNSITAIEQASGPTGPLWLGTNGGGLACFRQGKITPFPVTAQTLPGTLYGVLADAAGRLWLSSPTGIYRVSLPPANSSALAMVTAYGTADGMNIRECSSGGHPAAWKLSDGSLWFATLDGVSVIDPAHAAENQVPPPVVIERVLVDDRPRNLSQELTVRPGANRLEFQYAGLSYSAPQKVQYRYRLHGFDQGWIDAGSRRAAFYTNLPPGPYRFEVLAANNDGVWSTTGATLTLRLLPHFYQTWWFYSALALASLLLVYLGYRWRVLQVEAQFAAVLAERGRLAREIHDTLAQGFVAVSVQLELVGRLLAGARDTVGKPVFEHLDQAREMVRASLAEARSSIWDLRSDRAGAADLPARLRQSSSRITSGSESKVYLQVTGTCRPLARKVEEELLRIAQEAVTNAVRHAGAARIDVQLTYQATRVALRVADDGCGFEPLPGASGPEGHFGIRGMHERAAEIAAVLAVDSKPGEGTRVAVEVPLA